MSLVMAVVCHLSEVSDTNAAYWKISIFAKTVKKPKIIPMPSSKSRRVSKHLLSWLLRLMNQKFRIIQIKSIQVRPVIIWWCSLAIQDLRDPLPFNQSNLLACQIVASMMKRLGMLGVNKWKAGDRECCSKAEVVDREKNALHLLVVVDHGEETVTSNNLLTNLLRVSIHRIGKDLVMALNHKPGKVWEDTKWTGDELSSIQKTASLQLHQRLSTARSRWEITLTGLTNLAANLLVCSMLTCKQQLKRSRSQSNKSWPKPISLSQFPWRLRSPPFRVSWLKVTKTITWHYSPCKAQRDSPSAKLSPSSWELLKSLKMLRSTRECFRSSRPTL